MLKNKIFQENKSVDFIEIQSETNFKKVLIRSLDNC